MLVWFDLVYVTPPPYMTPLIKQLLRKRNKLRRNGKISQANTFAAKINALILQSKRRGQITFSEASPKQLWAAVKSSIGSTRGSNSITDQLLNNVDAVSDYFAGISYRPGIVNCSIPSYGVVSSNNDPRVDDYTTEHFCDVGYHTITSPGLDALPSWLFSKCSYELAGIITYFQLLV